MARLAFVSWSVTSRRIRFCLVALALAFAPLCTVAQAHGMEEALKLYHQGDFAAAALQGKNMGNAEGWALAARALLVEAAYRAPEADRMRLLGDAEAAARTALAKNPDNVEAMLHLVIALGYRARIEGLMSARREGLAEEGEALIDRAIELEPDNPWAYSMRGGWNGEIISSAGSFLGGLFYGASMKNCRVAFDKAMMLAPDTPVIPVEYAKILLSLNKAKYRHEALVLLAKARTKTPADAFEKILLDQAGLLDAALVSGDKARIAGVLKSVTPFRK